MTTREILEKVRNGEIPVEEAESFFKDRPYEDLGFARLDTSREMRSGFPEVVYCESKDDAYLPKIFETLYVKNGKVLGTRASAHQAELIREVLPDAVYDPVSRIVRVISRQRQEQEEGRFYGRVCVCSGGTADIPVAEEAASTAAFFGAQVDRVYDVGVSGIHRLFASLSVIREADCIIAVAGMEGALASVVAGLVENPVFAVPTHVGYGANLGGLSALLTMINSCANGISVVNIDNGYGAGYQAAQIARLAGGGRARNAGNDQ